MPEAAAKQLRLLIDACLTPAAIPHLDVVFGKRIDAVHVDQILGPATPDDVVFARAVRERRIVLTANDMDFVMLARAGATHHGLGLINDQNTGSRQIAAIESLVGALLNFVDTGGATADHVFVVRRSGRLSARRMPS